MAPHELMANYLASIELLAKQLRVGETVSDTCLKYYGHYQISIIAFDNHLKC